MTDSVGQEGFVYLIGSDVSPLVKIGRTVDLERRLGDIQRMSPAPLKLLWTHKGSNELETALHNQFSGQRRHGEWFDLGDDPVAAVIEALPAVLASVTERYKPRERRKGAATPKPPCEDLGALELRVVEPDPANPAVRIMAMHEAEDLELIDETGVWTNAAGEPLPEELQKAADRLLEKGMLHEFEDWYRRGPDGSGVPGVSPLLGQQAVSANQEGAA